MRSLAINEIESVSGGDAVVTALVITAGVATVAYLSGLFSSSPQCKLVDVPYTSVEPVYDAYGHHIADRVIDYTVPEWVCV